MLNVIYAKCRFYVVMLSVVALNVVAPWKPINLTFL
jgi:hypothetical protein